MRSGSSGARRDGEISEAQANAEIDDRAKRAREIDAKDRENQRPAHVHIKHDVDNNESDINVRPTGTSAAYALRRLRKDRPDIHARVLAGELTAHAGMVEAGFRKKRKSKRLTPLQRIAKLDPKYVEALIGKSEGAEALLLFRRAMTLPAHRPPAGSSNNVTTSKPKRGRRAAGGYEFPNGRRFGVGGKLGQNFVSKRSSDVRASPTRRRPPAGGAMLTADSGQGCERHGERLRQPPARKKPTAAHAAVGGKRTGRDGKAAGRSPARLSASAAVAARFRAPVFAPRAWFSG